MKIALVVALASLAACSSSKKPTLRPDASSGGVDASSDGAPAACGLLAQLGSPTSTQIDATYDAPTATTDVTLTGDLNADPMPDYIQLEFYKGTTGAFSGGFAPKMITLTGDELSYGTCGACVFAYDSADPDQTSVYFATGGTMNLTSISTDYSGAAKVEGTLTNVTMQHVLIDFGGTNESTPAPDGCSSTLTSYAFSATTFTMAM